MDRNETQISHEYLVKRSCKKKFYSFIYEKANVNFFELCGRISTLIHINSFCFLLRFTRSCRKKKLIQARNPYPYISVINNFLCLKIQIHAITSLGCTMK